MNACLACGAAYQIGDHCRSKTCQIAQCFLDTARTDLIASIPGVLESPVVDFDAIIDDDTRERIKQAVREFRVRDISTRVPFVSRDDDSKHCTRCGSTFDATHGACSECPQATP